MSDVRVLGARPLAGLAALLVGLGFGRFAYTALVPGLIEEGWIGASGAGPLAAANFAGYLVGALGGARLARRFGAATTLRWTMVATALALLAGAASFGLVWLAFARFAAGVGGAVLMVVAPTAVLRFADPARRGAIAGVVFTGIGLGVALSGTLVPAMARSGVAVTWIALGLAALVLAIATARVWPDVPLAPPAAHEKGLPRGFLVFALAYCTDAAGFVPHTVYWVDYVARGLDRGLPAGGLQWTLFGVGAAFGPLLAGRAADRFGFRAAFSGALALKAFGVALPLVSTAFPILALSSLIVGALTPGAAMLASGRAGEIAGHARHASAWALATAAFAATQALAALGFSRLLAATHAYGALWSVGAGLLVLGATMAAFGPKAQPHHA
ncbi:MAG: MFS transporter [Hyphomicrobiales bacterium]|nr:MFS transporter [Hyphomicrobiales bacterium]